MVQALGLAGVEAICEWQIELVWLYGDEWCRNGECALCVKHMRNKQNWIVETWHGSAPADLQPEARSLVWGNLSE